METPSYDAFTSRAFVVARIVNAAPETAEWVSAHLLNAEDYGKRAVRYIRGTGVFPRDEVMASFWAREAARHAIRAIHLSDRHPERYALECQE